MTSNIIFELYILSCFRSLVVELVLDLNVVNEAAHVYLNTVFDTLAG